MKSAASLYEVIAQQESVLHWCRSNECRAGYFVMLYRRMTEQDRSVRHGRTQVFLNAEKNNLVILHPLIPGINNI
jgi:hypothetical protein